MPSIRFRLAVLACALALTTASRAHAQYAQPPQPPQPTVPEAREMGWLVGISGFLAHVSSNDGDVSESLAGGGGGVHFGGLLRPDLALIVEVWGSVYDAGDERTHNQLNIGIGAQYWVRKLWLKGSFASSEYTRRFYRTDSHNTYPGHSFTVGAGYEVVRRATFAVDIRGQLTWGRYPDGALSANEVYDLETTNVSLGVGLTWF